MKNIAIVRGKFLNRYEMQMFEPLTKRFHITAFGSMTPFHDTFAFPVVKLPSPMDVPDFPFKMPILNRLFIDAHYLYGLERKLRGYDLVHTAETYYRYTQQALNAKRNGYVKKVIATVLENIPGNNEGIWGRRAYKRRARKEIDHFIAISERTKSTMVMEGTDPNKITVIGYHVDTKRFTPAKGHGERIGDGGLRSLTILYVGRLEVCKGVLDILSAARMLLANPAIRRRTLRWVFVGEGSQELAMRQLEQQMGKNWHFEHVSATYDEMPGWYQQADIFVAPSAPTPTWEEQFNIALLEAQSSGLPIVTTTSGAIPENVGDAAITVQPGHIGALHNALLSFIVQPTLRLQYAKRARERAVSVHDIQLGASQLAALYDHVLGR